ncbi:MAG: flagellar basal-body rod protein FlgF [Pseudomonadota bacterium]
MEANSYISLSLAAAARRDLEVTANNIANANTAGFKGERLAFEAYLLPNAGGPDTEFVIDAGSYVDTRQGGLVRTGNPLDIALNGDGWLSYRTPEGQIAYGRDGQLSLSADGILQTQSGAEVLDSGGGTITLPPGITDLKISPEGTISSEAGELGQIGMFDVLAIQSFERLGAGMFAPPPGAPDDTQPAQSTELVQGSIEASNVHPVAEVTRLMEVQKSYERATKLIENEDKLVREALRRIGRMG